MGTGHGFHRFSVLVELENVGHEDGMHTESTRKERQAFASDLVAKQAPKLVICCGFMSFHVVLHVAGFLSTSSCLP